LSSSPIIFRAPGQYVQGSGALNEIGAYVAQFGRRVLVAGGRTGLLETRAARERGFAAHNIWQTEVPFNGETCDSEINRVAELAKRNNCDVIMACGGGKVIDTVKAAAQQCSIPAVIIPTIASNDAPCSALSVVYNEDGTFERLMPLVSNPALVLVDTLIIARAPVRQLVSGMGDALATWFEMDACIVSGAPNTLGGQISLGTQALARLCLETILEYGREAMECCAENKTAPALERVVEANTLLSGLGFESGGVAAAHALSESFSLIPEMHGFTHGEKVAFGLLVHMTLEGRSEEVINEILRFCIDVGLPVTLGDLAYSPQGKLLREVALDAASEGKPSHNLRRGLSGDEIFNAILRADEIGQAFKE